MTKKLIIDYPNDVSPELWQDAKDVLTSLQVRANDTMERPECSLLIVDNDEVEDEDDWENEFEVVDDENDDLHQIELTIPEESDELKSDDCGEDISLFKADETWWRDNIGV